MRASCLFLKNADTGGKAVQEVGVANRADFAITEEASNGNGSGSFSDHTAIVVRFAVEVCSTAVTGEQQAHALVVQPFLGSGSP